MPKDNPWAGIQSMGALDQKLYQQQKNNPTPSPTRTVPKETNEQTVTEALEQPPSVNEEQSNKGSDDVETSSRHDVNYRVWRDIIENTETHNSSLRLTAEENFAVEDVITDLKRQLKIKTSLNEVARLGLLYLVHDFKKHREKSLLYKVKKS
jgi:hypothetical protein